MVVCNNRAATKSGDDDSRAMATGSLTQQGSDDLVKQTALKIIPEILRSDVIFLHILAVKRLCCLIDVFLEVDSSVSILPLRGSPLSFNSICVQQGSPKPFLHARHCAKSWVWSHKY